MRKILQSTLLVTLLPLGAGWAQSSPPAPPPASFASADKASDVPDAEKLRRSSEAVSRMRGVLKDTLGKLEEARNSKDVVKLNCVNEKLTQIKGLLRISEQADVSLQEDVAKHDASGSTHEYTKVSIAKQKVEQLRSEAEQCIGQLAFRTDENLSVEVETPSDLPTSDPTNPAPPPPVTVTPPPASPTL